MELKDVNWLKYLVCFLNTNIYIKAIDVSIIFNVIFVTKRKLII